jgi:inner membrane protein
MVLVEGLTIGWALLIIGVLLLMMEVFNPGFFIAVPGTVLIILGVLILLGVDIFSSAWGIVLAVVIALAAAGVTIWLYSSLTPNDSPVTISRDSLVGRKGRVLKKVDPDTLSGKVLIEGQEWSAKSTGALIDPGAYVLVVRSKGVHVIVEEVKSE